MKALASRELYYIRCRYVKQKKEFQFFRCNLSKRFGVWLVVVEPKLFTSKQYAYLDKLSISSSVKFTAPDISTV